MTIKNPVKILIIALPFAWLSSIVLPFLNQQSWGIWLIESLAIQGYWNINMVFYTESLFIALITAIPYVGIILWLIPRNQYVYIVTAILSYALFTFLLCFQKEHLTACLFTLVQSTNIAVYVAIFLLFEVIGKVFSLPRN